MPTEVGVWCATRSGAGIRTSALKGTKPRKRPEPPQSPALQMQHAGFGRVGFHFVPVDIGQHVPVDLDTRRNAPPALFEHLKMLNRLFMISRFRSDLWCFHRDVLGSVSVFWLRGSEFFGLFFPVNSSRKGAGSKFARRFPQFKPKAPIRNEVERPRHTTFIPFQTPEAFRNAGSSG
jgi:hypothetical protein